MLNINRIPESCFEEVGYRKYLESLGILEFDTYYATVVSNFCGGAKLRVNGLDCDVFINGSFSIGERLIISFSISNKKKRCYTVFESVEDYGPSAA